MARLLNQFSQELWGFYENRVMECFCDVFIGNAGTFDVCVTSRWKIEMNDARLALEPLCVAEEHRQ